MSGHKARNRVQNRLYSKDDIFKRFPVKIRTLCAWMGRLIPADRLFGTFVSGLQSSLPLTAPLGHQLSLCTFPWLPQHATRHRVQSCGGYKKRRVSVELGFVGSGIRGWSTVKAMCPSPLSHTPEAPRNLNSQQMQAVEQIRALYQSHFNLVRNVVELRRR